MSSQKDLPNSVAPGPEVPIVATTDAALVDARTAVLNGQVNPRNLWVRYYFLYDFQPNVNDNSDRTKLQWIDAGAGNKPIAVNGTARFLKPNETYYFRIVAVGSAGGGYIMGDICSFQTPEEPAQIRMG